MNSEPPPKPMPMGNGSSLIIKVRKNCTALRHRESLFIYTRYDIDLPSKPRKHFSGTNQGDMFENVPLPSAAALWTKDWGFGL